MKNKSKLLTAVALASINSTINLSTSMGSLFYGPNKLDQQREVNKMRGKDRNGLPKKRRKMW